MEKHKVSWVITTEGEYFDMSQDNVHVGLLEDGDRVVKASQIEYLQKQKRRREDKTDFVWIKFAYNKDFYKPLSFELVTRLFYFATFCKNDNYVMQHSDVKEMLKISAKQLKTFRDVLYGKVIIPDGSRLYLKPQHFGRGEIEDDNMNYTRLFTGTTRYLYENCSSLSKHTYLAYIFKMITYVNRATNILSANQKEQDINSISYLTFNEYLKEIGRDITHANRIRNELSKFRLNNCELAVGFFNNLDELIPNGKYVVVNPRLFYGGDRNTENYKKICKLFDAERQDFETI